MKGSTTATTARRQLSRPSTQADVAELAGVSVATVSYVANGRRTGRKNVATAEVADRVVRAMRELNYRPRRAGRVLARNRTDLVAIVTYTPSNPWATTLINEVESAAAARDMGVVILRYGHTPSALERVENLLSDGIADAAVILGSKEFTPARAQRIGNRIPTLITGDRYRPRGFDVMVQHEAAAVSAAVEHLVRLGVRKPAYLAVPIRDIQHRTDAFVETFLRHGLPRSAITVVTREHNLSGFLDSRREAVELLDRPARQRPDAIMAHSDRAAISAVWAAMELGISVPDELKIIGNGNIGEATEITPALTTLGADPVAYQPMLQRLLDRIDAPDTPAKTIAVPWRLILRGTA